ncbi:flagella synthesis protein FlgN [Pseudomonas panipatensis]|uniref:Flagella synthesis protein FlgN n=1 Tax=Pseudomonas panipatensis TaxID=428992 RepID=A0A1G8C1R7_9PSED|nr:flagellar export chaperone FlgN [Pseudomonas panipatensis]SDH39318.1 flagella synthesis protein FlgN [Pseudomonas panipatensis]SMP66468.1 flagella synthesis protein FlgN [Pseudomonas panipatensis]
MPNATLLRLITDDIAAAQTLLQLIEDEFQALEERDLPRLQTLLDTKLPLLHQLEEHGRQRSELLRQAGVSADRTGLAELAALGSVQAATVECSDALNALLERCQQANLRNGRVIRNNQNATGRLLDILRGQETPSLYDRHGGATPAGRQRPLSQA